MGSRKLALITLPAHESLSPIEAKSKSEIYLKGNGHLEIVFCMSVPKGLKGDYKTRVSLSPSDLAILIWILIRNSPFYWFFRTLAGLAGREFKSKLVRVGRLAIAPHRPGYSRGSGCRIEAKSA